VFRDVYVPASVELTLAVRSVAAYLLVQEQGGVLAGYSAAALHHAACAPADAPAEVLVPRPLRARSGLLVHHGTPPPRSVTIRGGCRVTTATRTAVDLARRLDLVDAVVAVDALARRGAFAPSALIEPSRPRGWRRIAEVVALADPRAESPMETRLRVGLITAGLPPPLVQHEILDEYGFVLARVDLAYDAAKLAIEYDGATHFDRRGRERDLQRDVILAGYGWQTIRLTRLDVTPAIVPTAHRIARLIEQRTRAAG
jgi:hypothetical protein